MKSRGIPWFYRIFNHILRLFFRLLYHEFSWSYDLVAGIVSLGRWQTWVRQALPYATGPMILELGHGPGHLQVSLLKTGKRSFAVDESWQMSRQAHRRIRSQGLQPGLARATAQALPFPAGCFNQVLATFPSEYILAQDTLLEIHRVLSTDGELVILPLAWITGQHWYERLAAWLFRVTGEAPAIEAVRNSDRFKQVFAEAGFHARSEFLTLQGSTLLLVRATRLSDR